MKVYQPDMIRERKNITLPCVLRDADEKGTFYSILNLNILFRQ